MSPFSDPEAPTRPDHAAVVPDGSTVSLEAESALEGHPGGVSYGLKALGLTETKDTVMTLNNSHEAVIEQRRAKAWEMRLDGKSYREIGEALGVAHTTAHAYVMAVLERTKKENNESAEHWRQISVARLEKALNVVKDALKAVLIDPETGMPIDDTENHELRLKAIDRLIKLEERKAKLLGMDAPSKVEANVSAVSLDEIDALKQTAQRNE